MSLQENGIRVRKQGTKPTVVHHAQNQLVQCPTHWYRTPVLRPVTDGGTVEFQVTSTTYETIENADHQIEAQVCLFGTNSDGNSVCGIVHGFDSYFHITLNKSSLHISDVTTYLNKQIEYEIYKEGSRHVYLRPEHKRNGWRRTKEDLPPDYVTNAKSVRGQDIMGWKPANQTKTFYKLSFRHPKHVAIARRALEKPPPWKRDLFVEGQITTYEANVPYELRFMADMDFGGHQWVRMKEVKVADKQSWSSRCQIEAECHYSLLEPIPLEEKGTLAPSVSISYDIECTGTDGAFPRANKNEVITIGAHIVQSSNPDWAVKVAFCLKKTDPSPDLEVYSFDDEKTMLCSFMEFIRCVDPDQIIGYNNDLFDNKYIYDRAEHLGLIGKKRGIKAFYDATRMKGRKWHIETREVTTRAHGTTVTHNLNMYGRYSLDVWRYVKTYFKLRSYGLNAVATHFLKERKVDLPYKVIPEYFRSGPSTRQKIAHYCSQDCALPWRLIKALMVEFNLAEMARVTGVPFFWLISRGQQIKVQSQLLRHGRKNNIFLPTVTAIDDGSYEGATVVDPFRGYYTTKVVCLDFASLYPSIMQEKNLSHDTFTTVKVMERHGYKKDIDYEPYTQDPTKCFVKDHIKRGLLPIILQALLSQRKMVKRLMAKETDQFKKAILNGRQLALKISANSVYGFTGVSRGILPCKAISKMVTDSGRGMIETLSMETEAKYRKVNGYPTDVDVIYGDTDSVFVDTKMHSMADAWALGEDMAKFGTALFNKPHDLELEKGYGPFLLVSKKRYAGRKFVPKKGVKHPVSDDDMEEVISSTGMENVRRDNCPIVPRTIDTVLDHLLMREDPQAAEEHVRGVVGDLYNSRVSLADLIISKKFSKTYEEYAKKASQQAHVELAKRIRAREPDAAPRPGDRVPYVVVTRSTVHRKMNDYKVSEHVEDPLFALENDILPDVNYYIRKQLARPLCKIFAPIFEPETDMHHRIEKDKEHLTKTFQRLFRGDESFVRIRKLPKKQQGGMMRFLKPQKRCLGCNSEVDAGGLAGLCSFCNGQEKKRRHLTIGLGKKQEALQAKSTGIWDICAKCEPDESVRNACANKDCTTLYDRKKVAIDIEDMGERLQRLVIHK